MLKFESRILQLNYIVHDDTLYDIHVMIQLEMTEL